MKFLLTLVFFAASFFRMAPPGLANANPETPDAREQKPKQILAVAENVMATRSFSATLLGRTASGEVNLRYVQSAQPDGRVWRRYDMMKNAKVIQSWVFNSEGAWRIVGKRTEKLIFLERFTHTAELNFVGITHYPVAFGPGSADTESSITYEGRPSHRIVHEPPTDVRVDWGPDPALLVGGRYQMKPSIIFPRRVKSIYVIDANSLFIRRIEQYRPDGRLVGDLQINDVIQSVPNDPTRLFEAPASRPFVTYRTYSAFVAGQDYYRRMGLALLVLGLILGLPIGLRLALRRSRYRNSLCNANSECR